MRPRFAQLTGFLAPGAPTSCATLISAEDEHPLTGMRMEPAEAQPQNTGGAHPVAVQSPLAAVLARVEALELEAQQLRAALASRTLPSENTAFTIDEVPSLDLTVPPVHVEESQYELQGCLRCPGLLGQRCQRGDVGHCTAVQVTNLYAVPSCTGSKEKLGRSANPRPAAKVSEH